MALDKPRAWAYVCQACRVAGMLGCRAVGAACYPGAASHRLMINVIRYYAEKNEYGRYCKFHKFG
jgi:hypothetical protein